MDQPFLRRNVSWQPPHSLPMAGTFAFSESRSLILALASVTTLAKLSILAVEAGLVFPDLRRRAVIALQLQALDAFGKHGRKLLGRIVESLERVIDGRLVVGLLTLDHRGQHGAEGSCRCAFISAWVCLTTSCCATTAPTLSSNAPATTTFASFARPLLKLKVRARDRREPACFANTACGLSFRMRQNIRDYAASVPRGSRSRPVRRSPACRCDRSCTRATGPR